MKINRNWAITGIAASVAAIGAALFYRYENNAEKPAYRVRESDGAFEIRDYAAVIVAETYAEGDRKAALDKGFNRLASYIFAKARGGDHADTKSAMLSSPVANEKIAMTAPVLSDRAPDGRWRTRFIMPSEYTRDALPAVPVEVAIDELPGRRVAAITFSGRETDTLLAEKEALLRDWVSARDKDAAGPAEYAFYHSPFIPGPLRRNEVLLPLA